MKKVVVISLGLVGVLVLTKLITSNTLIRNIQDGGDDKKQLLLEVSNIIKNCAIVAMQNQQEALLFR